MELSRMRRADFIPKLLASTAHAFVLADRRRATWAEQEFLNAYIRDYPGDFAVIPCGCNYQYVGIRREAKCAGQPVHVVHHWCVLLSLSLPRSPLSLTLHSSTGRVTPPSRRPTRTTASSTTCAATTRARSLPSRRSRPRPPSRPRAPSASSSTSSASVSRTTAPRRRPPRSRRAGATRSTS